MTHVLFRCHLTLFDPSSLEELPLAHPYSIEDAEAGELLIGGWIDPACIPAAIPHVHAIEVSEETPIDWESQWTTFAPDFHEGIAHIDLSRFGSHEPLLLKPGSGFGDLSHPTTQLALELLASRVAHKTLIDIGCGSGILSLAALKLGASAAYGIDIDSSALEHARANTELNQLTCYWGLDLPNAIPDEPILIVMNMITSEQEIAWESQPAWLRGGPLEIVTSGMLSSQRDGYIERVKAWGWELTCELTQGEWVGLVFRYCPIVTQSF